MPAEPARSSARSAASSFSRAQSRSASRRELANTIVERCCSIRSSTCSSTCGQIDRRTACPSGDSWAAPVCGTGGRVEVGHVLDRDHDAEVDFLGAGRGGDGHRPGPAQERRHVLGGPDGGRQADPLGRATIRVQRVQPFQGQGQVRAALVPGQGVHFVHDHGVHPAQRVPRLRGEQQEQRLGRGDQDVRRLGGQPAALLGGGIPGPHRDSDVGLGGAHGLRGVPDAGQRGAQVPLDVHRERLQRGDVQHPAAEFRVLGSGGDGQPVQRPQECGQRLARPGRRDDQGVLTLADRGPGLRLGLGGGGERGAEPVAGDGAEALERVPLASCRRTARWCGLARYRTTGHRYMVHGHTDRNKRPAQTADSCPAARLVPDPPRGLSSADPQRKPHPGAERTDPTSGPEVLCTVQTTVRSPADQAPASG